MNGLHLCLFIKPKPVRLFGGGVVTPIGLAKLPLFYEGEQITILARVFRDVDFPKGRHVIIGNNHQYLRYTIIDFREMMYYTTTDNGNVVAIPGSVGKGFNGKLPDKFLYSTRNLKKSS